jgi:hypothetical protein
MSSQPYSKTLIINSNDLPNYKLLAESDNAIEILALCLDNFRGIKRKLVTLDEEE